MIVGDFYNVPLLVLHAVLPHLTILYVEVLVGMHDLFQDFLVDAASISSRETPLRSRSAAQRAAPTVCVQLNSSRPTKGTQLRASAVPPNC